MDKKERFFNGLVFGTFLGVFYFVIGIFTRGENSDKTIGGLIVGAVIGGIIGGTLYGWAMALVMRSRYVKKDGRFVTGPGEKILCQGSANHFKGMESIGGQLYLTDRRIVFKSHKLNIQNGDFTTGLENITSIGTFKSMRIFNNGLAITIGNGKTEKFIVGVTSLKEWVKHFSGLEGLQSV